jgi:hypothetical protein
MTHRHRAHFRSPPRKEMARMALLAMKTGAAVTVALGVIFLR